MANPEGIAGHDMTKLNFDLTLDGSSLNFQAVFSAFERQINEGRIQQQAVTSSSALDRDKLSELRDAIVSARDEAYSVNSMVESSTQDVISSAASCAADCASEHASEAVSETAWEHSPGSEVNCEVIGGLDSVLEIVNAALA